MQVPISCILLKIPMLVYAFLVTIVLQLHDSQALNVRLQGLEVYEQMTRQSVNFNILPITINKEHILTNT